jgi:Tol biopolymer transport system component/tRNA A-37 threonylcarbamoyl transferase component Bud32
MIVPGTKLGTYEVTSHIGSGGMGEVYQAHDSKLGRDVAIKVLPEQFARDPERLARFQREAKMLAALNHPNIAAIYGLEQSGDTHYLVMELVPGETLRERVAGGRRVPVEEALTIARQIAEALEAAHNSEKGIIHRDLKPANVKVTPEGRVKVLDFGLAKAFATNTATEDPSNSPTLSALPTQQGVIMGTAAYMSPEQARGKTVDKRTDIWAFGCVLYELLTGRAAFQGEDVTEILAAVMMKEPAFDALPANTPSAMRTLLRRCLRKDRRQRLQDATGVRIEIEEALAVPYSESAAPVGAKRGWRQFLPWAVALVLSACTGIVVWNLKPSPPRPVTRTVITLPPGQELAGMEAGPAVALSPDGTQVAYVARQDGTQQLFLRAMDSTESRAVPGTEGGDGPFFSPDGQWLGFFAGGKMKKIAVGGGAAVILGDAVVFRGASWDSRGMIAFPPNAFSTIMQMSDGGGAPQALTRFEKGENSHRWPEFLPGSKAVLFSAGQNTGNWSDGQVAVQSMETGERRNLVEGAAHPRYASSGHLIYAQAGNLVAVPFDPQSLQITGTAVPVVEGVLQSFGAGGAQYSFSAAGSLVYVPGRLEAQQSQPVWVSRNGAERPLALPARAYRSLRLSPDGRRAAASIDEQGGQVWLYDLSRETLTRFTFEGSNGGPAWTRDGKRIAFSSNKEGLGNIFWQAADGSGGPEQLTTSEYDQGPTSWAPDGQLLAFSENNPATKNDIWVLQLNDRKSQPFLRTPFAERAARFSPDGRWLAYASNESGRYEIYVQPYPGPGEKWQISTEGGTEAVWNPSGRELFYRSGNKMMAVEIATQPAFSAGKPGVLFEAPYLPSGSPDPNYDVSPDGQRFLMLKSTEQEQAGSTQIDVVLNWFEELKQRVPTGTK